jgi:LAO/AO transport system kinase
MAGSATRQVKSNSVADGLARSVLNGNLRAAGRVLSLIDDRDPLAKAVLKRLYARTGRAHIVGVTGSAGTGKSTLIGCLTTELRRRKKQVGVLTIDPTSPFSGGALLGDRVRMRDHFLDKGVFIRSLATRGSQSGLSNCVCEAAQVMDAMGKEYILIETIGIGQDQVDVSRVAHTVVLVVAPESGDEIQSMKAGIMEIADLVVINKSDLPGAEEMFLNLHTALGDRAVPIVKTSAQKNEGIETLVDEIVKKSLTTANHRQRAIDLSRTQLMALIRDGLMLKLGEKIRKSNVEHWAQKIADRKSDPYTAAETILGELKV